MREIDKKNLIQINNIDWGNFETAYGNAKNTIPNCLKNLYCENIEVALEASHQLWCSLCHQHSYISSASLPAYEIIKNRLTECDEELKIELLDIMLGFASCANQKTDNKNYQELTTKIKLFTDKEIYEKYTHCAQADIKEFAELITGQIKKFMSNT